MYQVRTVRDFSTVNIVRLSDNASIPVNENNTDYQEYLKWLSEGNVPEEVEVRSQENANVEIGTKTRTEL